MTEPPEAPGTAAAIRILVVDDHAVVRQGVQAFLDAQPDLTVVAAAGSGEEAVALAGQHRPDVAFVDLIMPQMDGVEVTRKLKTASPATRVVVLTSYHEDEHVFPAIRAGALSYLLKDVTPEDLADAARKAARGEAILHPRVATRMLREIRGVPDEAPNPFVNLTERELEVLRNIAHGYSNAVIAEALCISEKTVKRHVSNLLGKLGLAQRTQAAALAWREGIVRRDD
ncbi:MAG: response regulator transcription factor [Acidobacteriota bacterium]